MTSPVLEANAIQLRRDTPAQWTATNPILREGEEGLELGTGRRKVGDGWTRWSLLPYDGRAGEAVAGAVSRLLAALPTTDAVAPVAASQGVTLVHNTTAPAGTAVGADVAPVTLRGGLWEADAAGALRNRVNDPHAARPSPVIELDWTAPVNAVLGLRLTNPAATSHGARVWVNGVPISSAVSAVAATAGGYSYVKLTAATAGAYRVRVEVANAYPAGLVYTVGSSAPAPALELRPRCAVLGDSWTEGALSVPERSLWPAVFGELTGTSVARMGQGSSGYIAAVLDWGARPYTDPTRLARLAEYTPDLVVIQGSQNDDNAAGSAIQAAAASVYATLAATVPDAVLLVVGPPRLNTTPSASRVANRDAVRAAALAAPNVLAFVDQIDGPGGPWFTGTGQAGATNGSGNTDVLLGSDGAHPTELGHAYLARRVAAAYTAALGIRS